MTKWPEPAPSLISSVRELQPQKQRVRYPYRKDSKTYPGTVGPGSQAAIDACAPLIPRLLA